MKQHEQALLYLKKAVEDERLLDEIIDSDRVSDEIFGFHCQQSAEKLLKALLSLMGVRFRKTHDLRELTDLLKDQGNPIPENLLEIDTLTPYGTFFRYDMLETESPFDRFAARGMVRELHEWVEKQIQN